MIHLDPLLVDSEAIDANTHVNNASGHRTVLCPCSPSLRTVRIRSMSRVALIFLSLWVAGCATPSITGPQVYRDGNLSFSLPAQWKVTTRGQLGSCPHAFVEAPGEAVVSIRGVPKATDPGLERYARDFSRKAAASTPGGKLSDTRFQKFQDSRYGTGLKESFSVTFMGVKIPHTRTYRRMAAGDCTYYLITQVAKENASKTEPGFRELLASFSMPPTAAR